MQYNFRVFQYLRQVSDKIFPESDPLYFFINSSGFSPKRAAAAFMHLLFKFSSLVPPIFLNIAGDVMQTDKP